MTRNNGISRRTAMKLAGAAAATTVVAGCSDNGNGDEEEEVYEMEPGERIVFYGDMNGWEGREPGAIDGVENPTLGLEEGEEYEIGWDEGDGQEHNIEIRDEGGDVVGDYATEEVTEPDDDQFIEFTASEEMAVYRCAPHAGMEGDFVINGDE